MTNGRERVRGAQKSGLLFCCVVHIFSLCGLQAFLDTTDKHLFADRVFPHTEDPPKMVGEGGTMVRKEGAGTEGEDDGAELHVLEVRPSTNDGDGGKWWEQTRVGRRGRIGGIPTHMW